MNGEQNSRPNTSNPSESPSGTFSVRRHGESAKLALATSAEQLGTKKIARVVKKIRQEREQTGELSSTKNTGNLQENNARIVESMPNTPLPDPISRTPHITDWAGEVLSENDEQRRTPSGQLVVNQEEHSQTRRKTIKLFETPDQTLFSEQIRLDTHNRDDTIKDFQDMTQKLLLMSSSSFLKEEPVKPIAELSPLLSSEQETSQQKSVDGGVQYAPSHSAVEDFSSQLDTKIKRWFERRNFFKGNKEENPDMRNYPLTEDTSGKLPRVSGELNGQQQNLLSLEVKEVHTQSDITVSSDTWLLASVPIEEKKKKNIWTNLKENFLSKIHQSGKNARK
jgi:hypothetical protein